MVCRRCGAKAMESCSLPLDVITYLCIIHACESLRKVLLTRTVLVQMSLSRWHCSRGLDHGFENSQSKHEKVSPLRPCRAGATSSVLFRDV